MAWQKQAPLGSGTYAVWDLGNTEWDCNEFDQPQSLWDLQPVGEVWGEESSLRGV